jgi:hypothetical protein
MSDLQRNGLTGFSCSSFAKCLVESLNYLKDKMDKELILRTVEVGFMTRVKSATR